MNLTLQEINSRLASIFYEPLKNFCNYKDSDLLEKGCALKHKFTKKIHCFKDYNLWRGRGDYPVCKGSECKFYHYVDPRQGEIIIEKNN